jgi:hypothetical protein
MNTTTCRAAVVAAALWVLVGAALPAHGQSSTAPMPVGAITPENFAKHKTPPPFDLTGTWQHELRGPQSWKFVPPTFELTPEAQVHYDAGKKALAEGKVYRDDIGQCWPAGMPLIMPSFNGESIGHWEGDSLVVDTKYFPGHHHWMDQGGASIPASDQLHIVERIRMIENGETLQIDYTMTDPKSWKGDWKMTKRFNRLHDTDITEVECTPELNENLPATSSESLIK